MKSIKCVIASVLLFAVTSLSSCSIITKVEEAVSFPEVYSITYEITTVDGLIHTMTKTVDEKGNVYYKDIDEELLFINNEGTYTLYKKIGDGGFTEVAGVKYTPLAVEEELSEFDAYATKTTDKFIPTSRRDGEANVAGRNAEIYKIGINLLAVSFYHVYYVDCESGVCLGVDVENKTFGKNAGDNEETFICTEYITENIEDLGAKIHG